MTDIAFLTTNQTKLAHAKYLSREFDVNIIQHKVLHYGIPYIEPRLFDRDNLLNASAIDAIRRWKKNISELENRLYFFEDTSVKIHALSREGEVPGVDIKYWMQRNSFNDLDEMLKANGNNRSVTIYSHLVLILTKDLKPNDESDTIIFTSSSSGSIIENEMEFDTNIVFPWLDNKTFNKWFVPTGYSQPISTLPIEEADKCDFRRGAFEKMLNFLELSHKIHKKQNHNKNLKFTFDPLFIVAGPTCAGKTTIGKYLLERYPYFHIEASDFFTIEFLETHGTKSGIDINLFAKEILKIKPFLVVDRILKFLDEMSFPSSIILTGFRTPDEISYFKNNIPYKERVSTIFISADYETRFKRWLNRNRDLTDFDKIKFDRSNNLQIEIGINNIETVGDIINIENNTSLESFYSKFENQFLSDFIQYPIENIFSYNYFSPKGLEDAIILALAFDYFINKIQYYTTTEIAHLINKNFSNLNIEKHKDNVSRYFNQKYYPYYEVKLIDNKNKYKLSPTGYSKAIWLLRNK